MIDLSYESPIILLNELDLGPVPPKNSILMEM